MIHCSTVEERVHMISQMLAQPTHGLVSQLSRAHQVSRQTLYRWSATGRQALEEALGKNVLPLKQTTSVPTLVLTMLIETHASYRGIQSSLRSMHGIDMSLGTIVGMVKEAGQRAQSWMNQQQAGTARSLALDEQYSSQRGKAYLNVIDVHSGQVWASIPPVEVDGESWTLLLWYLREQGISSLSTVSDGGRAIQEALSQVHGEEKHQRDVWHLFHVAAQVQGRLDRAVKTEQDRLSVILRQAEREAAGKRARGRHPKAQLPEQQALLAQMSYVADGVRYLCQELHTEFSVVVLRSGRVLSCEQRQDEIEAVLELLDELAPFAIPALQGQIQMLSKQIRLALPQALLFARLLDARQEQASCVLGPEAVALLAWAWLRRAVLGPTSKELLQSVPSAWRADASHLLAAWDQAVRASSAVENWHSIVRPHLAVHRKLSAGMLALLAVWHNHRIAPRGLHEGLSPLQRTGSTSPDNHWLAALGYSALAA
jgi:transposase-like protein